jgi:SAM-dependent methyltransferase
MSNETTKSIGRRVRDPAFAERYFVGHGIDIGAGSDGLGLHREAFPRMVSCFSWDKEHGDAQVMEGIANGAFDFVHSSHCLEHLRDPHEAIASWLRIVKPGGYIVVIVPDEDMYEQGVLPSTFNSDHKWTFATSKMKSWSPKSMSVTDLINFVAPLVELIKIESLHLTYDWNRGLREDQTQGAAESAIEFIMRKRPANEIADRGRFPPANR